MLDVGMVTIAAGNCGGDLARRSARLFLSVKLEKLR